MSGLNEYIQILNGMSHAEIAEAEAAADVILQEHGMKWLPNPGPQQEAYYCLADQLLYGGMAGGGKSDLIIGLATQSHRRSLLLRRQNLEVVDLYERCIDIVGHEDGFAKSPQARWNMPDGRLIMFGGCQYPGDEKKYKGQAKDFIGVDEATEFQEHQIEYVTQWLRTKEKGPDGKRQRCRLVLATNPPTTAEGEWVIRWFAPWVDPEHELYGVVKNGELLYWQRLEDDTFRFEFEPFQIANDPQTGEPIMSRSRTFIRSTLQDNPDLAEGGEYAAELASKPMELRRRYERGEFVGDPNDDEFQVIPTLWVLAAQQRWKDCGGKPPEGAMMTAMGVDIAQGGKDSTVLAPRYGEFFADLIERPGIETPDGPTAAGVILMHLRHGAQVNIDLGGGYGGSAFDFLRGNEAAKLYGFVPSGGSTARTRDGKMTFKNTRAEAYWLLREALEPSSEFNICLPPDAKLRADLCAPTWKLVTGGHVQLESKEDIKKRIGRSPDKGDAVVISWFTGASRQRNGQKHVHRTHVNNLPTYTNQGKREDRRRVGRGRHQGGGYGNNYSSGEQG